MAHPTDGIIGWIDAELSSAYDQSLPFTKFKASTIADVEVVNCLDTSAAAVVNTGSTNGTQFGGGSSVKLGFYAATPATRPTGSSDVLAGLVTLGLRDTSANPPLDLGTGTLTCGTLTQSGGMYAGAPSPANHTYASLVHEYFNDFTLLTVDYDATNDWALTEDDAACTQAITADATCGELLLTNKATTDDNAQQIILAQQSFKVASGKKIWFETKFKTAGATEIDWAVGLIDAEDLTGVADNYPANGIVVSKLDGATTMILSSSDGGTDTVNAAFGTWDTSYHTVGFYFNGGASGVGTVQAYIDGVATGNSIVCTYATMSKVAPLFMVRNGDGVTTQTMTIDYVKCIQLR